MVGVRIEITRFADDSQPGWVEGRLIDAHGNSHVFVEKLPVVSSQDLNSSSAYPQPGVIACQIVERSAVNGYEVVKIETILPWHLESTNGEVLFDVLPEQIVEID